MNDLMGLGSTLPFLPYADRWRKQRRIMQQYFGPQAIAMYRHIQEQEVHIFLRELLHSPQQFLTSSKRLIATISMKASYGNSVISASSHTDLLEIFVRVAEGISAVGDSGGTIIDLVPVLRKVPIWFPSWFPGVRIKRHALQIRTLMQNAMTIPVEELRSRRMEGQVETSFISSVLDDIESSLVPDAELEEDIKVIGLVTFSAAYETTYSTVHAFFLSMVLNPEVVKKAHAELDNLTRNGERLLTMDDRPALPYIDAIVKEVYRYHPGGPMGLPHATTHEEVYGDWTIPAGSVILGNIWEMMKDKENFPDPERFLPDRHIQNFGMDPDQKGDTEPGAIVDPSELVFGFGRRICPGRYLADATIWLTVANVLAVFDIKPYVDPESNMETPPIPSFTSGFTSSPNPFKCKIIPRSERHASLVKGP